jgi:filamentous hemagglutinin
LYYNTIDSRADFFAASDTYYKSQGVDVRWFGGADSVSRAKLTGLGADGHGSSFTFALGSVFGGGADIYAWRSEAGNALMRSGFDNFRSLYNNSNQNPVAWDINQLKNEQQILQPIHQNYLGDKNTFTMISGYLTNSEGVFSPFLKVDQKQDGGVYILDYNSLIKYGCKLLGYTASQGC